MNNLKANFILLCDNAFMSESNKLNVIGVFESYRKMKDNKFKGYLVASLSGIPNMTYKLNLKFEKILNKKVPILLDDKGKDILIIELDFKLPKKGVYQFNLYFKTGKIGSTNLKII